MKSKILVHLFFIFFASHGFSELLDWSDLEVGQKYPLGYNIALNSELSLPKNSYYRLIDITSSDAPVLIFTFKDQQCVNPNQKSDLILFNPDPENPGRDRSIGIEYQTICDLIIYVESPYYFENSIFLKTDK